MFFKIVILRFFIKVQKVVKLFDLPISYKEFDKFKNLGDITFKLSKFFKAGSIFHIIL